MFGITLNWVFNSPPANSYRVLLPSSQARRAVTVCASAIVPP